MSCPGIPDCDSRVCEQEKETYQEDVDSGALPAFQLSTAQGACVTGRHRLETVAPSYAKKNVG